MGSCTSSRGISIYNSAVMSLCKKHHIVFGCARYKLDCNYQLEGENDTVSLELSSAVT